MESLLKMTVQGLQWKLRAQGGLGVACSVASPVSRGPSSTSKAPLSVYNPKQGRNGRAGGRLDEKSPSLTQFPDLSSSSWMEPLAEEVAQP